ncbi:MAG: hypothetical protein RLY31_757 [Bacteroidota bacterium]|jgi:hypothetical protein
MATVAVDNGLTDACGIASLDLSQTGLDCSHIWPNTLTLTAKDIHVNSAGCRSNVTVQDKTKPKVVCKDATIVPACRAILNPASVLDVAASNDNCRKRLPLSVSPAQFNCIDTGPNTVTRTATDGHSNTLSGQAMVTVVAPLLTVTTMSEYCGDFDGTISLTITGQQLAGPVRLLRRHRQQLPNQTGQ